MKLFLDKSLHNFQQHYESVLKQLNYQLTLDSSQAEVIVSSDENILKEAVNNHQLKVVQLVSAGYDFVPLKAFQENKVVLANARDVYSDGIAEFVIGRILYVLQQHQLLVENQKQKQWDRSVQATSLKNMKVGIIGAGSIGQEIAKRLEAFELELIGFNTSGQQAMYFNECYKLEELDQHLPSFDIIILAIPLNEDTLHLINQQRIKLMKKEAILVNIARGPIIDEQALIEALDTQFRAAILDVFEKEPLEETSPLWSHPKVLISPHTSFKNNLYQENLENLILENLKRIQQNKLLLNII